MTPVPRPDPEPRYLIEQVDEVAVVQLHAPGFDALSRRDKLLVWHLYEAALAGRDIYIDQRYGHALEMRAAFEGVLRHPATVDPVDLAELTRYAKLFWINNGPHNHLTARKFVLRLTPERFARALTAAAAEGARWPRRPGETLEANVARLGPLFLDPDVDASVTRKTPDAGQDILASSANNLYQGVTLADLEGFEERFPLTSRLVRRGDRLEEEVYRIGGRYSRYIERIVTHLRAAAELAPPPTAAALRALIRYYETGHHDEGRAYDVAWVADQEPPVDTINGFIEVYMDPRGQKGAWEALVFYAHPEKTRVLRLVADHAQWFEDHMPWDPRYRRAEVTGVSSRAIEVVVETGESGPVTPIGINLPNDQTVRERFGSKSVLLSNVLEAYERSQLPEFRAEFSWSADEAARAERWSALAAEITTNMHEVIGHGSGRVSPELGGHPQTALREHYSALEESRADLVALYFLPDPKLAELGVLPAEHQADIVRAEYEGYARNALVQLRRIREGTQIEEDHMRNRQMIVSWLLANTAAIDVRRRDGRTYYVVDDVDAFRDGVGRLLAEVQRIKSEGDYAAARTLFEQHGIHFDPALRDEIVARADRLALPSYTGFVQPRLELVRDESGAPIDVAMTYPWDLAIQMLEYSERHALDPEIDEVDRAS
jgi:dipeptidyl-peptidase-3